MDKRQKNDDPFEQFDHLFDETEEKYHPTEKQKYKKSKLEQKKTNPRKRNQFPTIGVVFAILMIGKFFKDDATISWIQLAVVAFIVYSIIKSTMKK